MALLNVVRMKDWKGFRETMAKRKIADPAVLNGICPYFTMFPLSFPAGVLKRHARPGDVVLDPFCGRGTTNFAARLAALPTVGIDVSPVAIAATRAKLVAAGPEAIVAEAARILAEPVGTLDIPTGEFWDWAFDPQTLVEICKLRRAIADGGIDPAVAPALIGVLLGALHGPLGKRTQTYFSNQCLRTFAPKPAYAAKYWRSRNMRPPKADVLAIIRARAERYYGSPAPRTESGAALGDSRCASVVETVMDGRQADWVITSPPYYGLRTYVEDQWLRAWLLGGPDRVAYNPGPQINHGGADVFAAELGGVWRNVAAVCKPGARMIVRFGAINDRPVDPVRLMKSSFDGTPWRITTIRAAGTAMDGKRQAATFVNADQPRAGEIDVYCKQA